MTVARSDQLAADHPILTYIGYVALSAVVGIIVAIQTGSSFVWGLFVILGVILPIALIVKARRKVRATRSDE
jgi:Flp pilus assembly protein TadB